MDSIRRLKWPDNDIRMRILHTQTITNHKIKAKTKQQRIRYLMRGWRLEKNRVVKKTIKTCCLAISEVFSLHQCVDCNIVDKGKKPTNLSKFPFLNWRYTHFNWIQVCPLKIVLYCLPMRKLKNVQNPKWILCINWICILHYIQDKLVCFKCAACSSNCRRVFNFTRIFCNNLWCPFFKNLISCISILIQ